MTVLLGHFVETHSRSGLMPRGEVQAFLDGLRADDGKITLKADGGA